jgi:hypothetical protein
MEDSPARRAFPWGPVLAILVLAVGVSLALRFGPGEDLAVPWQGIAAAILAAGAAYLIGWRLLNALWGLALALLLTLPPLAVAQARGNPQAVLAEALVWTALALTVGGWRLTFQARASVLRWAALLPALCLVEGIAWLTEPRTGLVASAVAGFGLVLAGCLALGAGRQSATLPAPSGWNAALALLVGLLAAAGGLAAAQGLAELADWLGKYGPLALAKAIGPVRSGAALDLLRAAVGGTAGYSLPGFAGAEPEVWCWPLPWVTLPLAAWGLWRALRRGRKLWASRRPPLSWLVLVFVGVDLLGMLLEPASVRAASFLPLAWLCTLLAVYCAGDLVRGLGERIMLAPPKEEESPKVSRP